MAFVSTSAYLATATPFIPKVNAYLTSIGISFVAVFSGIAIAWLLIQQRDHETAERARQQADRIRQGVEDELDLLKVTALRSLTFFTHKVYERPAVRDQWDQDNYLEVRSLLRIGIPIVGRQVPLDSPLLANDWERDETSWTPVLQHFASLSDFCGQTIRLFGPALVEYRTLLKTMRAVQRDADREAASWQIWQRRNEERWRWLATQPMAVREISERPDHFLPAEAIQNLQNLAVLTWSLIVAVTHVLGDWEPMPPEEDMGVGSTIFGWPETRFSKRSEA